MGTGTEHEYLTLMDPASTALLVIDMQNDFCDPRGFYAGVGRSAEKIAEAIEPTDRLLEAARRAGVTVVYTRLVSDDRLPSVEERRRILPARWSSSQRRLTPGGWGSEIVDALKPEPTDFVVEKTNYSAFLETDLDETLRRRGVCSVIIAGTTTYACVLHTAFDAFCRDLDVVMARDAVSCWFDELQVATFDIVELLLGRVASVDNLVSWMQTSSDAEATTQQVEEEA